MNEELRDPHGPVAFHTQLPLPPMARVYRGHALARPRALSGT